MTRAVVLNGALLALVALAIVTVEAVDRPEAALEARVRRYAVAISSADLNAAMAEIAPARRIGWTDWVRGQLGNMYEVRGVAVRATSLMGRPTEVTVVLDVNRDYPDEFYQPTATVGVEPDADGQWYLSTPLLAPR